jgi:predicted MFS family arabinose efflux permease
LNRALALVAASLVIWGIGEGMFIYFEPVYLQQLGADPITIGAILGAVGVAMMVVHLPAGYLADRIGRKPLLVAAWIFGSVSTWVLALAGSVPVFVLGMVLYGATAFVSGPLSSYITAARGSWSVGRALTLVTASFSVGAILGPLIGGWVGETYGLKLTFLIAAVLFILSTGLVLLLPAQPVEATPHTGFGSLWRGLYTPRFNAYLAVIFFSFFALWLAQPLAQNFLQYQRGVSLGQIGALISIRSVGVVVMNLTLGQINARRGFLLAHLFVAGFSGLMLAGLGLPGYFAAYFLLGSYNTSRSLASAQARALVGAHNMGLAYGSIETAAALAISLAPLLAGLLYARSPELVFVVSIVAIGLALLSAWLLSPLHSHEVNRIDQKEALDGVNPGR